MLVSGDAVSVEGIVFGQSITPVNVVNDDGTQSNELDLTIGPLSITSDNATTNCDSAPGEQTCTSTLDNLTFSLYGIDIITASSLTAQSNSSDGTSDDAGTGFSGLCILESLGNPCTQVPDAGQYVINIPGIAQGVITVRAEDHTMTENGVPGSGLTVTMLRVELITPNGPINLDLVQAHSFAASAGGTTPSPVLPPPAAPTVAQLPVTGGPPGGGDASYGWYIALAALIIFASVAVAMTSQRARRNSHISDR